MGVAATIFIALGSWFPSFWYGEAAIIAGARRSFVEQIHLALSGDAGHMLWRLVISVWHHIAGDSEFALRFPSAVCAGFVVAGVVILGQRLADTRVGVFAGLVAAVLPRTTEMGMDVEGFAFAAACATWAGVALIRALRAEEFDPVPVIDVADDLIPPKLRRNRNAALRRRTGRWLVYVVLLVLSAYAFPTGFLVTLAHPFFILLTDERRGATLEWFLAAVAQLILVMPLMWQFAITGLLDWRGFIDPASGWPLFRDSWTPGSLGWLSLIPLGVAMLISVVSIRSVLAKYGRSVLVYGLASVLVPISILTILGFFGIPMHPDYAAPMVPAVALLAALGIASAPSWLGWLVMISLLVTGSLQYGVQRMPAGVHNADGRNVASFIKLYSEPGDAIFFEGNRGDRNSRELKATYPASFEHLVDIGLAQTGANAGTLWDESVTAQVASDRLAGIDRLWMVRDGQFPVLEHDPDLEAFRRAGFAVIQTSPFSQHTVYQLVRTEAYGLEKDGSLPKAGTLPAIPTRGPSPYEDPNATALPAPQPGATDDPDTAGEPGGTGEPAATGDPSGQNNQP